MADNNRPMDQSSQKWAKVLVVISVIAAVAGVVTNLDAISKVIERWTSKGSIPNPQPSTLSPIVIVISQELLIAAAKQQSEAAKTSPAKNRLELLEAETELRDVAANLQTPIEIRGDSPKWFSVAKGELGQKEIPGAKSNPRIDEYLASTDFSGDKSDNISWTSAFANWAFAQAGVQGTGSTNPVKWLKWGVQLKEPRLGALTLVARANGVPTACFFVSQTNESILCLGGNFADSVSIVALAKERLIGYRWPT